MDQAGKTPMDAQPGSPRTPMLHEVGPAGVVRAGTCGERRWVTFATILARSTDLTSGTNKSLNLDNRDNARRALLRRMAGSWWISLSCPRGEGHI